MSFSDSMLTSPASFVPGSDLAARVALAVAGVAGSVDVAVGIEVAGSALALVSAVHDGRDAILPLSARTRMRVRELATGDRVVRVLGATCASGLQVLTPTADEWPTGAQLLGRGSPLVLWVRGDLSVFTRPSVAITGPQEPNAYERHVTLDLATGLASRGWSIAAGTTTQVDDLALRGALAVEGRGFVIADRPLAPMELGERSLLVSETAPLLRSTERGVRRAEALRAALASKTVVIGGHGNPLPPLATGAHALGLPVGRVVAEGLSTVSIASRTDQNESRARAVSALADVEFL